MEKRLNIETLEPKAYKAMYALVGYLQTSGLSKTHIHLINMRASQLNNCAYCLNMHTKEALNSGETQQRLFLLATWRETNLFTKEEEVILTLTEEITLIHNDGVSDIAYKKAVELLGETYVAQIIMAIVTINAWNRIAVSTNLHID
jgi:AhpD family alkylhydroperoxidase